MGTFYLYNGMHRRWGLHEAETVHLVNVLLFWALSRVPFRALRTIKLLSNHSLCLPSPLGPQQKKGRSTFTSGEVDTLSSLVVRLFIHLIKKYLFCSYHRRDA